ncbi:MAG: MBL fold metallo-hydrolase [Mariprofundaceae bacterium]|nr:MBL fold metallo-hydrolase [Mariprofundaceae bacterium]
MILRQLFDEDTWTYTYLLADEESKEAVLIDSVLEQLERDLTLIKELGLKLKYTLDTHVHADHITASGPLRERTGCQTGISEKGNVACIDLHLKGGDILSLGSKNLKVLATPGHTPGCISFVCENMVFTGDSLFIRGCGRTDFQNGDSGQLYDGIVNELYTLPDETLVYPGHDYRGQMVSTIGEEKAFNPRLNLGREGFITFMNELDIPNPKKLNESVPANLACGHVAS